MASTWDDFADAISDDRLRELGVDPAEYRTARAHMREHGRTPDGRPDLSKQAKAQLGTLLNTCKQLQADGYDGTAQVVWGSDGMARLQLDPQAGRSTDEPPVC